MSNAPVEVSRRTLLAHDRVLAGAAALLSRSGAARARVANRRPDRRAYLLSHPRRRDPARHRARAQSRRARDLGSQSRRRSVGARTRDPAHPADAVHPARRAARWHRHQLRRSAALSLPQGRRGRDLRNRRRPRRVRAEVRARRRSSAKRSSRPGIRPSRPCATSPGSAPWCRPGRTIRSATTPCISAGRPT